MTADEFEEQWCRNELERQALENKRRRLQIEELEARRKVKPKGRTLDKKGRTL